MHAMTNISDIERLNYYEGEYLGAVDFLAEQEYHRDMRRRHNLGPHTWGIVTGLDIAQFLNGGADKEVDVYVQPGMAVDGFGREILLFSPLQLTPDMFSDFPQKRMLTIWVAYNQQMIQPASDLCSTAAQTDAFSRVLETYQIVIQPQPPTSDPLVIAGNQISPPALGTVIPPLPAAPGDIAVPPDQSVPYQELPSDNTAATWLIQLGQVMWDGTKQRFLQVDPAIANFNRQFIGSVESTIYAPAGILTIQDRFTQWSITTPPPPGVAVEVQGSLTVDRLLTAEADAWMNGGRLYFKESSGTDGDTPLWIQRVDGSTAGAALHIHIGDKAVPEKQLTVGYGPSDGTAETNVFTVGADGNASLPDGSLSFGSQLAQSLNLWGTSYGIGVQPSTLFFRSGSDFTWYVGGNYSPKQDDPGGGSLSMKLDSIGSLLLNAGVNLDSANLNNAKISPGLIFGQGSGEGIASKRTAGGNQFGLDFYTGFAVRMSITNPGNVGIGTTTPDAPLNVAGGNWDVGATEGDLKVGNDNFRFKVGVALGGAGAGDVRMRAVGGTSRLMLGSAANDVLAIAGNNVGIGTLTPARTLDVAGDIRGTTLAAVGGLSVAGGISASGGMSLSGGISASGGASISGNLFVSGNISAGGSKAGYLAERFVARTRKPLERGDVVVLHSRSCAHYYGLDNRIPLPEVHLTDKVGDTRVCGIVDEPDLDASDTPGIDRSKLGSATVGMMVTFGAYAFCKVDADEASIEVGDLLTTSATRGHAQKLAASSDGHTGKVLGKALAALEKGKGLIPILVLHQ
jgi:hypothetical protein